MAKVKVGVIGVGYLGQFHAEKYAALPDVELVGIVDSDNKRATEIAQKLKTQVFADAAGLLGKVDAVSIVVPTVFHYRVAKQFLERGVHVLIEKPVTVTLAEADELIGLAAAKRVILQVGHIERFNPALTAVSSSITSPRYLTAERSAAFTVRCTDVNVILDLMIHDLDIVTALARSEPKEVSAAGASVITKEIDMATARILFRNGCIADVVASRVSDEKKRLLRVFDGERMYTLDFQMQKAVVSRRGTNAVPELVAEDISQNRCDTLNSEILSFINCIRTGAQPLVSGREGRQALVLASMITENISKGITGFVPVIA